MAGTLAFVTDIDGTVNVRWTPDEDAVSGTLYYWRGDTGVVTSATASSGVNSISDLPAGYRYAIWIVEYDVTPALLSFTNPVFGLTRPSDYGDSPWWTIEWRTDRHDWDSRDVGTAVRRVSVPTSTRGYWHQMKMSCFAQNKRLVWSSMKLHLKPHGRGEEVAG